MGSYNIVVADDHPSVRHILKVILSEGTGFQVIGEAADGVALLNLLSHLPRLPDMVILDQSMPRLNGTDAIRQINCLFPSIKVLMLTVHRDREYVSQAMNAGANGYLLKEKADSEMFVAIQSIRRGGTYISPLVGHVLV